MDIKIVPDATGVGNLSFRAGEPEYDNSFETAVYLSLFTHRGWWGDQEFGSYLHLLSREKFVPGIEQKAKVWAEEALAWITAERIAKAVTVNAERLPGTLVGIEVVIERLDTNVPEKYNYNWEASTNVVQ